MLLQESLTSIDRCCCKSCCEADRSILLMNRIGERCHRDLKYSSAVDEGAQSNAQSNAPSNAPSNAAISTTAKSAADE